MGRSNLLDRNMNGGEGVASSRAARLFEWVRHSARAFGQQPSVASRRERSDWSGFEGHVRQTGGKIGYARGASDPHPTGPLRGETRCTITLVDVSGV